MPASLIIPALIGAAASLIGGISKSVSQRNQILDERAYNSPSAQRQRLMEAGISPFGQQFENTSVGMPDITSGVADSFAEATKHGISSYVQQKQQQIANEIARDQLQLQKETLNATKEYRKSLLDYYNDKLNISVAQFGMKQRLARDVFGQSLKKFSWEKKKWSE